MPGYSTVGHSKTVIHKNDQPHPKPKVQELDEQGVKQLNDKVQKLSHQRLACINDFKKLSKENALKSLLPQALSQNPDFLQIVEHRNSLQTDLEDLKRDYSQMPNFVCNFGGQQQEVTIQNIVDDVANVLGQLSTAIQRLETTAAARDVEIAAIKETFTEQHKKFQEDVLAYRNPTYSHAAALQKSATALLSTVENMEPEQIAILGNGITKESLIEAVNKAQNDANVLMEEKRKYIKDRLAELSIIHENIDVIDLVALEMSRNYVLGLHADITNIMAVHQEFNLANEEIVNWKESCIKECTACYKKLIKLKPQKNGQNEEPQVAQQRKGLLASLIEAILGAIRSFGGGSQNAAPRPQDHLAGVMAQNRPVSNQAAEAAVQEAVELIKDCEDDLEEYVKPWLLKLKYHENQKQTVLNEVLSKGRNNRTLLGDIQESFDDLQIWYSENASERGLNDEYIKQAEAVLNQLRPELEQLEKYIERAAEEYLAKMDAVTSECEAILVALGDRVPEASETDGMQKKYDELHGHILGSRRYSVSDEQLGKSNAVWEQLGKVIRIGLQAQFDASSRK